MLSHGSAFGHIALNQGVSDLYRLFANGEDGFLFGNFGDLSRLFTTSQGLVQVANDGDPVGLALEDSDWQRRTLAAQLAQASDVLRGAGVFSSAAGWFVDGSTGISGGKLNLTNSGFATYAGAGLVQNARYRCSFTIEGITLGSASGISMRPGNNPGAVYTAPGTYTEYIQYTGAMGASDVSIVSRGGFPVGAAVIDNFTVVPVVGNHGSQGTGGQRPFYKSNTGKPYLLLDGIDDRLATPFATASAANTLFFAGRGANTFTFGLGALNASNNRLLLGVDSSGRICAQYGALTQSTLFGGSDIRGQDRVFMVAGDGTSVDLYLDGALVATSAPSGTPVSGVAMNVGAYSESGTAGGWWSGRISAAGQINRKLTAFEIAMATAALMRTYQ